MKKILFITSSSSYFWTETQIEILGENYECISTHSLAKAKEIIESGVDKIVMYPFYISWRNYDLSLAQGDLRNMAGYYFWVKDIFPKEIPTIVVLIKIQPKEFVTELLATGWQNEENVRFFDLDIKRQSSKTLAELIKS